MIPQKHYPVNEKHLGFVMFGAKARFFGFFKIVLLLLYQYNTAIIIMYTILLFFTDGEMSMDKILINAYAKINITLDVLKRRPDGYHELEMIMQSIDVFDSVEVKKNDTGEIRVFSDSSKVPEDRTNIAYKAAEKMLDFCGIKNGVDIYIKKRIPVAAGLAGGSADGAAVIKAIRDLFVPDEDIEKFSSLAGSIGKDLPFCLKNGTAFAYGLGDELTYIKPMPESFIVLAKPDIDVPTAMVYKALDLKKAVKRPDTKAVLEAYEKGDMDTVLKNTVNVLETVTAVKYPVIEEIKNYLVSKGALASAMSGSGPSVYGIFESKEKADKAAEAVKEKFGIREVFSTKTINPQD